jgi:membrane-bound lytic murein transglycosylase MltF
MSVLLLVAVLLLAPACGGSESQSAEGVAGVGGAPRQDVPAETSVTFAPTSTAEDQLTPSWRGDFNAMTERRLIRVATTFSRTNYFLDAGQPRGAGYEGLMEFEKSINRQLGSGKLEVEILMIPMRRDRLFSALVEGYADLAAANLTVTPERLELVDFSDPVYQGVSEVIVTGPGSPQLGALTDLAGREVHVRRSSSFFNSLTRLSDELVAAGGKPIKIRAADEILETEDLLELVASGNLPLTVADSHIATFWAEVLDGLVVREDLALVEGQSIAWAFRKNSPELAEVVNSFVAQHKKGTLFGNVILKRYLQQNDWVRNPLSEKQIELFARYRGYFQKYAEEYGVDWVLSAAQGFQESGFDQNAKSRAGAVGIMQIKPSTAADKNVGIPDITSAENNIHAGIKYLAFIRDRYFTEGPDPWNQQLLALAAYNAGPARIRQFRQQAVEKGLDPDVWFREVEQVASRETVTYVSNIAKYYVTYTEQLRRNEALEQARP